MAHTCPTGPRSGQESRGPVLLHGHSPLPRSEENSSAHRVRAPSFTLHRPLLRAGPVRGTHTDHCPPNGRPPSKPEEEGKEGLWLGAEG